MAYEFDFAWVGTYTPELVAGTVNTLEMTLGSIVPGFILGTACAVARLHGPGWLRRVVTVYVEGIRNTPLVIQAFWLFFGLAVLGARVDAFYAAIFALTVNVGAYTAEIMRAGFQSIPRGQLEAGSCLAMSRTQMFFYIELPQAVERVYPALVSQFILMMLATSIMSTISAPELTGTAHDIEAVTFRNFEVYVVIAPIYLALTLLVRGLLFGAAQLAFPRLRRLGTPL